MLNIDRADCPQNYDLQWCFFIVIGGAKVHIRDVCPKVITWQNGFPTRPHLPREATLTPKAVVEIIRSGYTIDIPSGRIEDQSKQDAFQKILVAGQVLWMALQCAVRKCYGLPLTLLEVHTMVHVVCALSMYCFWLKVSIYGLFEPYLTYVARFINTSCRNPRMCMSRRSSNPLAGPTSWH